MLTLYPDGNRRFRVLCEINLERYEAARTKMEKTLIVAGIVDAVRHGSGGLGAFVKEVRICCIAAQAVSLLPMLSLINCRLIGPKVGLVRGHWRQERS